MKKIFILQILLMITQLAIAQITDTLPDGEAYWISLGTSRLNAVSNDGYGFEGYKLEGTDIKVFGFFHKSLKKNFARASKLEMDKVAIVIKFNTIVLDSQVYACKGFFTKWREFSAKLKDVKEGNYTIDVYDVATNKFIYERDFEIASKEPIFVKEGKPFVGSQAYAGKFLTSINKLRGQAGDGKSSGSSSDPSNVIKSDPNATLYMWWSLQHMSYPSDYWNVDYAFVEGPKGLSEDQVKSVIRLPRIRIGFSVDKEGYQICTNTNSCISQVKGVHTTNSGPTYLGSFNYK